MEAELRNKLLSLSFTFLHRLLDKQVIYYMPKIQSYPVGRFIDIGTNVEVAAVIVLNFPEP